MTPAIQPFEDTATPLLVYAEESATLVPAVSSSFHHPAVSMMLPLRGSYPYRSSQ